MANQCVLYMPMDEGTGDKVYDLMGGNTGTIHGATWIDGRYGKALHFDTTDYVELGATKFDTLTDSTLSLWFNISSFQNWQEFFSHWEDGDYRYILEADANGYITSGGEDGDGNYWGINYNMSPLLGSWVHVVVTMGTGGHKLYINGNLVQSNSSETRTLSYFAPSAYNDIGHQNWGSYLVDGMIDEVRIFNYVLAAADVLSLYQLDPRAICKAKLVKQVARGRIVV